MMKVYEILPPVHIVSENIFDIFSSDEETTKHKIDDIAHQIKKIEQANKEFNDLYKSKSFVRTKTTPLSDYRDELMSSFYNGDKKHTNELINKISHLLQIYHHHA
jgi:predicted translin family RNA/ssDNA-binding protein